MIQRIKMNPKMLMDKEHHINQLIQRLNQFKKILE